MKRGETLYDLLKNRNHKIGAELGVFRGATSRYLLNNLENLKKLICVDPGLKYPDFEKMIYNKKLKKTDFEKSIYQQFLNSIKEHEKRVEIYKMFSSKASKYIEDDILDFIFIDGNHAYEYVKEDIELGYPKVKKGGLISGHDYGQDPEKYPEFGVDRAVNELLSDKYYINKADNHIGWIEK